MKKTIEQKVSGAILQENFIVKIGGVDYEVTPPSCAVLMKVSEILSEFTGKKLDETDVLSEVLRNAKDCEFIGRIVAQMILGVKKPKKRFSMIRGKNEVDQLAEELLLAPPKELNTAIYLLFRHHEVGDFFRSYRFPFRSRNNETDEGSGNDSPWSIIAGVAKYYELSPEFVLYDLSFENLIMYSSVIPSYDKPEPKKSKPETKTKGIGFGSFISQMKKLKGQQLQ